MTLEEFRQIYPSITPQQLARLTGKSLNTVYKWYQKDPIPLDSDTELRLSLAHYVWSLPPEPEIYAELLKLKADFFGDS